MGSVREQTFSEEGWVYQHVEIRTCGVTVSESGLRCLSVYGLLLTGPTCKRKGEGFMIAAVTGALGRTRNALFHRPAQLGAGGRGRSSEATDSLLLPRFSTFFLDKY